MPEYSAPDGHGIGVICLPKGAERYIFVYDMHRADELYRLFGRFAANPELSFTWHDCKVLCQKLEEKERRR